MCNYLDPGCATGPQRLPLVAPGLEGTRDRRHERYRVPQLCVTIWSVIKLTTSSYAISQIYRSKGMVHFNADV